MRVKMQPGAEFDVLTPHELRTHLLQQHNAFMHALHETRRGMQYHRFILALQADAAGNLSTVSDLGPESGFVWDVRRITISNSGGAIGAVAVFVNDVQPTSLVQPSTACPELFTYSKESFVMKPNELLAFVGTALGAGNTIYISGQANELAMNEVGRRGLGGT